MPRGMPPYSGHWALFLDIDGTLLDITGTPEGVAAGARRLELLTRLREAASGALALISGRPIASIDALFLARSFSSPSSRAG